MGEVDKASHIFCFQGGEIVMGEILLAVLGCAIKISRIRLGGIAGRSVYKCRRKDSRVQSKCKEYRLKSAWCGYGQI